MSWNLVLEQESRAEKKVSLKTTVTDNDIVNYTDITKDHSKEGRDHINNTITDALTNSSPLKQCIIKSENNTQDNKGVRSDILGNVGTIVLTKLEQHS